MNIYPAILTDQPEIVAQQLQICQESGLVETVHIDIIDGYFVDNITVSPTDLVGIEFGAVELDFHIMTQEPIDFVRELIEQKDSLPIRAVIGQVERMTSQELFVDEVRRYGWKVGMSLDVFTPLQAIESTVWDRLHCVQLMGVEAGFQGAKFHPLVFEKINQLHEYLSAKNIEIEVIVDGGVTQNNLTQLQERAVSSVAIGSNLWHAPDFAEQLRILEAELL